MCYIWSQLNTCINEENTSQRVKNNDNTSQVKTVDFMEHPANIHPTSFRAWMTWTWADSLLSYSSLASSSGFVRLVSRDSFPFYFPRLPWSPFLFASPLFRFFFSYAFLLPPAFPSLFLHRYKHLSFLYFYSNYCFAFTRALSFSLAFSQRDSRSILWELMVLVSSLRWWMNNLSRGN